MYLTVNILCVINDLNVSLSRLCALLEKLQTITTNEGDAGNMSAILHTIYTSVFILGFTSKIFLIVMGARIKQDTIYLN